MSQNSAFTSHTSPINHGRLALLLYCQSSSTLYITHDRAASDMHNASKTILGGVRQASHVGCYCSASALPCLGSDSHMQSCIAYCIPSSQQDAVVDQLLQHLDSARFCSLHKIQHMNPGLHTTWVQCSLVVNNSMVVVPQQKMLGPTPQGPQSGRSQDSPMVGQCGVKVQSIS